MEIYIIFLILAYLFGSVLFGYWIPKWLKGIDIRLLSKDQNPGTANVFLHAGVGCGILTLLLELAKGILPMASAIRLIEQEFWKENEGLFSLFMVAPVLGHAFPIFHKWKDGGKGIAVTFGVLLGMLPFSKCVFILAFWYIVFSTVFIVNPHSYRTEITFLLFIISELLLKENKAIILGSIFICLVVLSKHAKELKKKEDRTVKFLFMKS